MHYGTNRLPFFMHLFSLLHLVFVSILDGIICALYIFHIIALLFFFIHRTLHRTNNLHRRAKLHFPAKFIIKRKMFFFLSLVSPAAKISILCYFVLFCFCLCFCSFIDFKTRQNVKPMFLGTFALIISLFLSSFSLL